MAGFRKWLLCAAFLCWTLHCRADLNLTEEDMIDLFILFPIQALISLINLLVILSSYRRGPKPVNTILIIGAIDLIMTIGRYIYEATEANFTGDISFLGVPSLLISIWSLWRYVHLRMNTYTPD